MFWCKTSFHHDFVIQLINMRGSAVNEKGFHFFQIQMNPEHAQGSCYCSGLLACAYQVSKELLSTAQTLFIALANKLIIEQGCPA